MLRRALAGSSALTTSSTAVASVRGYRLIPHMEREVEELAETQKAGRWQMAHKGNVSEPVTRAELMCDNLNMRERRRNGTLPEKAFARNMTQFWAKDGVRQHPDYKSKMIRFTVVGFDGHPYHFKMYPMPESTLNSIIDGSGMNWGHTFHWQACKNPNCLDMNHSDGCLVNVDLETLDKLPVPGRFEYYALTHFRLLNRGDINYSSRFSCQIYITDEVDGAVFAMKQHYARSLREKVAEWGEDDTYSTLALCRCRKLEPWAPMLEEPTLRDFPITQDMLWVDDYEEILKHKYPNYKRKDGFHTKPAMWSNYV
jgi:hypothetical protein